jgi:NAD(P)-dependent dehydrogenase (short-subunit alcohol dehydrogenase family)
MNHTQRHLLITGAAGGIGAACVALFAAQGWRVFGVDRSAVAASEDQDIRYFKADISDPAQIDDLFTQVAAHTGRLDALVNNAAVQFAKPLLQTQPDEWDALMNVNVRAAYLCVKAGYPLLKAARGAVVNMASVHAVATSADIAAYAASKGALLALTRAMAIEFAPDGVRANAVLPGAVDTAMLRDGLNRGHVSGASTQERLDDLASRTVIQRVGTPAEIAQAVYFLADSARSSFMTGQPLIVDGGATTRLSTE